MGSKGDVASPSECEHKWILKGGSQSGGKPLSLFQCEYCGRAIQRETNQRGEEMKRRVIHKGWS
jgi:hypothetical protein